MGVFMRIKELDDLFTKWKDAHEEECEFYKKNINSTDYIHYYFDNETKTDWYFADK